EHLARVEPLDELERDEVVVEADLVAELLETAQLREQRGLAPVRRRVQDEVRGTEPALGLEPRELERALEPRVDVVPQRQLPLPPRELAHRHDFPIAEPLEEPRVLAVGEAPLRERKED